MTVFFPDQDLYNLIVSRQSAGLQVTRRNSGNTGWQWSEPVWPDKSGGYGDPSWITSLAGSKITGNISGNAGSISGTITEGQVTGLVSDLSTLTSSVALKAPLASPALTGVPTAPTAAVATNTTQIATTAFVLANAGSSSGVNPSALVGLAAVNGTALTFLRSDGAPALDQSITPTWTGTHRFSARVGIGTAPSVPFHVVFTQDTSSTPQVIITNNGTGHSSMIALNAGSTGNPNFGFQVSGVDKASISWSVSGNYIGLVNYVYSVADFGVKLGSDGSFLFQDAASSAARFSVTKNGLATITVGIASSVGLIVKAAASQSANLLELQNSNGTALSWVTKDGCVAFPDGTTAAPGLFCGGQPSLGFTRATGTGLGLVYGSTIRMIIGAEGIHIGTGVITTTALSATTTSDGDRALVLRGASATQSGNLTEWQKSDTTVYATVSESGYFTTRKNSAPADAELAAGEAAYWFDSTNGASAFNIKAKQADGTVKTATIPLL